MKVFFLASINVNDAVRGFYKTIIKILEEENHKVIAQHSLVLFDDVFNLTEEASSQRAKELMKKMLKCDFVVFVGSKSTTGGGFFVSSALQRSLPVLYLVENDYKGLYLASSNRLLKIKKIDFSSTLELKKTINDFTKFANKKRLDNRFNLMISDTMDEHLNRYSKDYGISKADYIRDLIYRDMESEE